MNIRFKTAKLERMFNSDSELVRAYGAKRAKKIKLRMAVLAAADHLGLVPTTPPCRRHRLDGDREGSFAVDLDHPFRLILRPATDPPARHDDGGIDLAQVTSIIIEDIVDYH